MSTVLDKGRVLAERIWRMWLRRLRQSPGVTLVLTPRHPLLVIHSREFLSFVTSWNTFECWWPSREANKHWIVEGWCRECLNRKSRCSRGCDKSELSRTVAAAGTGCPPNVKVTSPAFTTMMSNVLDQWSPIDLMMITMIVMMVGDEEKVMFLGNHDFWESKIDKP